MFPLAPTQPPDSTDGDNDDNDVASWAPIGTGPRRKAEAVLKTEMQQFGRPAARAVWRQGRLGLERTARSHNAPSGESRSALFRPTTCLQCYMRVLNVPARFYSSQLPSKDTQPPVDQTPSRTADPSIDSSANINQKAAYELPSTTDSRRSNVNQEFSRIMDNLQARVLNASQTLNDITGYSGIEAIKRENEALETALSEAHTRVRTARQTYKSSNTRRATTQREVTTLLARKDTWSPVDLERFTELYRADHVLEGEVAAAQEALTEAEADEQKFNQKLSAGILKRYHEEQIWSDRIRRASTWGTWGLMGMNFILFVVLQFVAEPWRRKRLVKGVVQEEKQVLEEVRVELTTVKLELERLSQAAMVVPVAEHIQAPAEAKPDLPMAESLIASITWDSCKEFVLDPSRWQTVAADLYSERKVDFRMKDASILALEGAMAGAAIAGSIALLLTR